MAKLPCFRWTPNTARLSLAIPGGLIEHSSDQLISHFPPLSIAQGINKGVKPVFSQPVFMMVQVLFGRDCETTRQTVEFGDEATLHGNCQRCEKLAFSPFRLLPTS
jgi:hypothetical protein